MYNNKLVCSVKANGKFLREDYRGNDSTVYLPFKTEYSLFLKNLSERRALVHVDIDGKNMTEGGLIVAAGQSVDLERPANFGKGRKFKFIEKTAEISNFRGDNPEDGLIVIKWQFELPPLNVRLDPYTPWVKPTWVGGRTPDWIYNNFTVTSGGSAIGSSSDTSYGGRNVEFTKCCSNSSSNYSDQKLGAASGASMPQGITVEGSKSNQNFSAGYIGNLEGTLYSMVIKLYGGQRPIYVKEKIQCPTCGRKWKTSFEFCGNCGTALK